MDLVRSGEVASVTGLDLDIMSLFRLVAFIECFINFRPWMVIFEGSQPSFPQKDGWSIIYYLFIYLNV